MAVERVMEQMGQQALWRLGDDTEQNCHARKAVHHVQSKYVSSFIFDPSLSTPYTYRTR